MKTRAITGFFFVIVMLASVLCGQYPFAIFFLLLSSLSLWEFYGLIKQAGIKPDAVTGLLNGILIYIAFALLSSQNSPLSHKLIFLLPLTVAAVFVRELFKTNTAPFTNIAYTFLGLIFVIVPFTFYHALAYVKGGFDNHFPLAFLIMLWSNDTGAYLSGRWLGRTKLFERHSPKKTWEGFIGGVVIASIAAVVISHFFDEITWKQWVSVAIIIGLIGTLGDLVESMLKRSINIKDSGGILPGHGGLLDRFDGLLLAAPVVFTYLYFILN
jgi:phosphatidate cytidylyltransferase